MVTGISHITFIVKDLDAATRFFVEGLGAALVYDSGERQYSLSAERFFTIGSLWFCIMQGTPPADRSYGHIALQIPEAAFDACCARIASLGVDVLPGRSRVEGEGRSLYFYDFDNHLFELHTGTLGARLAAYGEDAPSPGRFAGM